MFSGSGSDGSCRSNAPRSKWTSVSVHSSWSSTNENVLSTTRQTTRSLGVTSVTRIRE